MLNRLHKVKDKILILEQQIVQTMVSGFVPGTHFYTFFLSSYLKPGGKKKNDIVILRKINQSVLFHPNPMTN